MSIGNKILKGAIYTAGLAALIKLYDVYNYAQADAVGQQVESAIKSGLTWGSLTNAIADTAGFVAKYGSLIAPSVAGTLGFRSLEKRLNGD